jgi:hypothetical protein
MKQIDGERQHSIVVCLLVVEVDVVEPLGNLSLR